MGKRGNYNSNNNGRGGGYNDRYKNDRGFSNNNDRDYVKKSGASFGYAQGDQSRPYVRGWNASKRHGLTTYMASPYKSKTSQTKQHTSKTGRVWENWACKVQPERGQSYFVSCLFEPATQKVIIPELSMVMNPKVKRGGYCGRNFYKD